MRCDRNRVCSSLSHSLGLIAIGALAWGCVPSQKCTVQKITAGRRLVTLVFHLRSIQKPNEAPVRAPWSHEYPEVLRGEYVVDGNAIRFAHGGVVYGRKEFLQCDRDDFGADDIVVIGSPEYIGCGSDYAVVYWDGRYHLLGPETAGFEQARRLVNEWSGGKAK